MTRRPRDTLPIRQNQLIFILAPRRDLLALPLALAEMDPGEVRRGGGGLAVLGDFDRLCREGVLGCYWG